MGHIFDRIKILDIRFWFDYKDSFYFILVLAVFNFKISIVV